LLKSRNPTKEKRTLFMFTILKRCKVLRKHGI